MHLTTLGLLHPPSGSGGRSRSSACYAAAPSGLEEAVLRPLLQIGKRFFPGRWLWRASQGLRAVLASAYSCDAHTWSVVHRFVISANAHQPVATTMNIIHLEKDNQAWIPAPTRVRDGADALWRLAALKMISAALCQGHCLVLAGPGEEGHAEESIAL